MKIRDDVLDAIGKKGCQHAHALWLEVMRRMTGGDQEETAKHVASIGDPINEAFAEYAIEVIKTVEFYGWESILEDDRRNGESTPHNP